MLNECFTDLIQVGLQSNTLLQGVTDGGTASFGLIQGRQQLLVF